MPQSPPESSLHMKEWPPPCATTPYSAPAASTVTPVLGKVPSVSPENSWITRSVTFPLPVGVIANTVPCKAPPPFSVVPTRSPALSRTKPEKGFQPVLLSTKLYTVLSVQVPFAFGVSSNTVPHIPTPPFGSPQVDESPAPPMNVVPQRLPALSNARSEERRVG